MKVFIGFTILILLLPHLSSGQQTFFSDEGKFKARFPEKPNKSAQDIDTEIGSIKLTTFIHEQNESGAYMVGISDYPSEHIQNNNHEELLNGALQGFTGNLGLTISKQEKITQNGYEGIYFEASNSSYSAKAKLVLAENRLYQVAVIADEEHSKKSSVKDFIDSFEILK